MSNPAVSTVYVHVVDAVVSKLREEFINESVDDAVLNDLQALWELKMMQCGVIQGQADRAPRGPGVPTPVHDLNVPYEATEEYETPTADMLFPPTPLVETPVQTPLPGEPGSYQYNPSGQSEYVTTPNTGAVAAGKPTSYMQEQSPASNQRPLGVDVNVGIRGLPKRSPILVLLSPSIRLPLASQAYRDPIFIGSGGGFTVGSPSLSRTFPPYNTAYEEGREEGGISQAQPPTKDLFMPPGKRSKLDCPPHLLPLGYIPQQDGSADASSDCLLQGKLPATKNPLNEVHGSSKHQERQNADLAIASLIKRGQGALTIPQHDGFDDVYNNGVRVEDYNTPSSYDPVNTPDVGTPKLGKPEGEEDEEPPLNEDDDDDLDDLDQEDEEPSINHLVLAQFEKVSRTKSKWKCILKDGIVHLNDIDILFTKANGEFDF